jgi:hypothetical protein
MTKRVVFLDIDGPMIPFSMMLVDRLAARNRVIPQIPVAVVKRLCERADAKVVFNTTHNTPIDGIPDIDLALVAAGLPRELIHTDKMTNYPRIHREQAVLWWLHEHKEVEDWIAFDDTLFTERENLIWVDPDAGLHLKHLNIALDRWGVPQFLVM